MNEERLWAPWRLQYVTGNEPEHDPPPEPASWLPSAERDCFLCRAAAEYRHNVDADRQLLVAGRSPFAVAVLNRYPYNNGHLLVAPRRHVGDLKDMSADEHLECMARLADLTRRYSARLHPDGFNIGLNLGRAAGAGLPGHVHWHLVPRWAGDNNFMGVVAGTRVIPQALDELWQMLREELDG